MHDLDDLLLGPNALDQLRADGLVVDPRHELLDDVEMNVGLEQRGPDLAQTFLHVRFGQHTADAEALERRTRAVFASRRTSVVKTPPTNS